MFKCRLIIVWYLTIYRVSASVLKPDGLLLLLMKDTVMIFLRYFNAYDNCIFLLTLFFKNFCLMFGISYLLLHSKFALHNLEEKYWYEWDGHITLVIIYFTKNNVWSLLITMLIANKSSWIQRELYDTINDENQ